MKKMHTYSLMAGISLLLAASSCSDKNNDDPYRNFDLIPVQLEEDGRWSFVNDKGDITYEDEFKEEPSWAANGIFNVKEDGGYALYAVESRSPRQIGTGYHSVGMSSDGIIPVCVKNSRISLIDNSGEKIADLEPVNGKEITSTDIAFCDGMLGFYTEDYLHGYVDSKGKVAIDPAYDIAYPFSEGMAVVGIAEKKINADDELKIDRSVIDKSGKTIFRINKGIEPATNIFYHGLLLCVDSDDTWLFIDKKGEQTRLPSKVKRVRDYNSRFIIYANDSDEYGVIDHKGETIIRPKYDRIEFAGHRFLVRKSESEYAVIDIEGNEIISSDNYEQLVYVGKFGFLGKEKGDIVMINREFKPKCKDGFYAIGLRNSARYDYFDRVESDYFNANAAATAIAGIITDKGIGKYEFGASPASMAKAPDDCLWKNSLYLDELGKSGYNWTMTVAAVSDVNLAVYSYYDNYNRTIRWNPDATIYEYDVTVSIKNGFAQDCYKAVVKELKNKGFTITDQTKIKKDGNEAVLKKGNTVIQISQSSESYMLIRIYDNPTLTGIRQIS